MVFWELREMRSFLQPPSAVIACVDLTTVCTRIVHTGCGPEKGLRRLSLVTLPGLPSSLPPSQISTEHLPAPKGQLWRLQNTEQIGDWSPPPEFTMETYD